MNPHRVISASIPPDLLARAHERASDEDRSVAAVMRQALREYLNEPARFERQWGSRAGADA